MNVRVGLGLLGALLVAIAWMTWWTSDSEGVRSELDLETVVSKPEKAAREDAHPAAQSRTLSQSPSLPSPVGTERRAARIEVRGRFILDDGSEILSPVFCTPYFTGRLGDAPEPPKVAAERGRFVFFLDQPEHLEGFSIWLDTTASPEMFVLHERDLALDPSGVEQVVDLGDLALLPGDRLVVQVLEPSGQPSRFAYGALLDAEGWFVGVQGAHPIMSMMNGGGSRHHGAVQANGGTLVLKQFDDARWLLVQGQGFEPELRSLSGEAQHLEVWLANELPSVGVTIEQGFTFPPEIIVMSRGRSWEQYDAFGHQLRNGWERSPGGATQRERLFDDGTLGSLVASTYSYQGGVLLIATPSLERGALRLASEPRDRLSLAKLDASSSDVIRLENDANLLVMAKRHRAKLVDLSQCDLAVFLNHSSAGLICFGLAHLQRSLDLEAQVGFAEPQDFIIEQPGGASLALDVRVGHRSSTAIRLSPDADGHYAFSSTCGQSHKILVHRGTLVDVFDVEPHEREVTLRLSSIGQLELNLPDKPALFDREWEVRLTDQASGWSTGYMHGAGLLTVELSAGRYEVGLRSEGLYVLPGSRFAPRVVEVQAGGTTQVTW